MIDARPQDGKPSLKNFLSMPMKKLLSLLSKAYKAQLAELKKGVSYDRVYEESMKRELQVKIGLLQSAKKWEINSR